MKKFLVFLFLIAFTFFGCDDDNSSKKDDDLISGDTDVVQEDTDVVPEDTDVIPEDTDVIPEDTDVIPEDTDVIPEDTDVIPEDTDVIPEDTDVIETDLDEIDDADVITCAEVDPNPGLTIEENKNRYLLDGWNWENKTLVFDVDSTVVATNGWSEPGLVVVDGTIHLYVSKKSSSTYTLFHSTSTNGVNWSEPVAVTGVEGARRASVIYEDNKFRMWYGSGFIKLAESSDGVAYTPVADSSFQQSDVSGAFDDLTLSFPTVIKDGDTYKMWYAGYGSSGTYAIGYATSPDGKTWSRVQATPVLEKGTMDPVEFDNTTVAQPWVIKGSDNIYRMWYAGFDTSLTPPNGPYRMGLAESTDGVNWTKKGVAVDISASGNDAYASREGAVIEWNNGWLMLYVGMGADYKYRLMSATSAVCPF